MINKVSSNRTEKRIYLASAGFVSRARKIIILGTVIEVGQAIIISALYEEAAQLASSYLYTCAANNTIIELILNGLAILFYL